MQTDKLAEGGGVAIKFCIFFLTAFFEDPFFKDFGEGDVASFRTVGMLMEVCESLQSLLFGGIETEVFALLGALLKSMLYCI